MSTPMTDEAEFELEIQSDYDREQFTKEPLGTWLIMAVPSETVRRIEIALYKVRRDMAVILQLTCDADEASAKSLLSQISSIAKKHPWLGLEVE